MIVQYSFDLEIPDYWDLDDQDVQDNIELAFEQTDVQLIGFERQCSWKNQENYKKNIQN